MKDPASCAVSHFSLAFTNLDAATDYDAFLRYRAVGAQDWIHLSSQQFWSTDLTKGLPGNGNCQMGCGENGDLNGPPPAFSLTGLDYGTTYEVQAALDDQFLDGLATTTVTTPDLPGSGYFSASPGNGNIHTRWSPPNSGAEVKGYIVQWKSGAEDYDGTETSERQAKVPGSESREYTMRVMAHNDDGIGVPSDEIKATPLPPPNSPATGAPTITGTAQVGETLTALTGDIADADGLTNATYDYQWLTDGSDIAGATSSTYVPVDVDEGKAIRVRVSFTDDRNHQESLTSTATAAVTAAADDSSIWSATLTVGSYSSGFIRGFWEDLGVGALTTEVFTLDGVDYTVTQLTDFAGNVLNLTLDRELPVGFTLQVGDATLSSGDADIMEQGSGEFQYSWWNKGVTLAVGDTVEVSLTEAE